MYAVFALAGVQFAAFASRIPDVKERLGLTAGELGITLLAISVGSLVGLPAAGWVSHRVGAARAVASGVIVSVSGIGLVGVGVDGLSSRPLVMGGLALSGLGIGVWDVGMNLEGASVERLLGRSIMPRFHASFSGGTVLSALVGSALSAWRIPVFAHLLVTGALVAAVALPTLRSFLPRDAEDEDAAAAAPAADPALSLTGRGGSAYAWLEPRTLLVGVVTFVAAFTEGTANDWLSVAMVEGHQLPSWAGVLGFATFLSAMTLGRVLGTRWLDRYGRVAVLRVLFLLALGGAALVVFGGVWLAFVGAALWGLGASLGFPVGMSAASDEPARAASRVSVVATIGYLAFLAGPPLIGLLGDRVGVLRALLFVGALLLLALFALPAVRPPGARAG